MEEMYHQCKSYMNRRVRVQDRCGRCYEGVVVDVDHEHLYLRMSDGVRVSSWFGFWPANDILTLSLFTLLAIALI